MRRTAFRRAIAYGLILSMGGVARATTGVDLNLATVNASGSTAAAVNLNNVAGAVDVTAGALSNSTAASAVVEINNNGTLTLNLGAMITNASGNSVEASGNSGGSYTLSGNIDDDASGIDVTNNTGGTFTFSGASKALTTGANVAVDLNANTGATIDFTNGGLDIDTTSGTGFDATGGGTIIASGSGNTINTGTGVGLNVASTDIGASDFTLQSLSSNGASNGIVLNATGNLGGLVITGDGSNTNNASGGTIASATDHGIIATDTQDLSLTSIAITNPGNAVSEHGIFATNLRGTSMLRASTISGFNQASGDGIRIVNTVDLTDFLVQDSLFTTSDGNDGVAVFAQGASTLGITITGTTFTDLEGDGLDIIAGDGAGSTGAIVLSATNNTFTTAGATGNMGIQARAAIMGTLTGTISGNNFSDTHRLASTAGVIEIQGNNNGAVDLLVMGNDLDSFNQSGINVVADDASDVIVDIDGNFIDTNQDDKIGIRSSIRNTGMTRLTIQNNQVGQTTPLPGTAGTRSAIDIEVFDDSGATDDVRILIDNNQLRVNKTSGTSEVLDFFIDTNADAQLTITNNTFTNVGSGDGAEIVTDTAGTTLCLDLRSNTAVNPGPSTGDIELVELAGSYLVESLASVAANNPGAMLVFDPNMAAFANSAGCLVP